MGALIRSIILAVLLAPSLEAQRFRYVIPLVKEGSEIVVQNFDVADQTVTVRTFAKAEPFEMAARSILRLRSKERGFVVVEAASNPLMTWSVVDGVMLRGVQLNTHNRSFIANRDTGVAIANPWDQAVDLTFWNYHSDGQITFEALTVEAGSSLAVFYSTLVDFDGDVLVSVLSRRPLAIAAARFDGWQFQSVPVVAVGKENN